MSDVSNENVSEMTYDAIKIGLASPEKILPGKETCYCHHQQRIDQTAYDTPEW